MHMGRPGQAGSERQSVEGQAPGLGAVENDGLLFKGLEHQCGQMRKLCMWTVAMAT